MFHTHRRFERVLGGGPDDQGQAILPLVLGMFVTVVVLAVVVRWGVAVTRASQAQAAADGAALAVALDGRPGPLVGEGYRISAVSGGRGRATVEVTAGESGEISAWATAVVQVTTTRRRHGLAPAMVAALARAENLLGEPVVVVSGYRSSAQQRVLWEQRAWNPYPVAAPGSSLHEQGLAVDVDLRQVGRLAAVASEAGLCHPLPEVDPVHFVVCPIPE